MQAPRLRGAVRKCAYGILATLSFSSLAAPTATAQGPRPFRVEEDWELVLRDPDPAIHSPQVILLSSPSGTERYFQLQLNHAGDSYFSGGGFQVSAIRNDDVVDFARSDVRAVLRRDNDHIRWTSVMAIIDGELMYAIKSGSGTDWGQFGGPEYLVRMSAGNIVDLSAYSPQQSVDLADIGFGANRVSSLTLKRSRVYWTDGTVRETLVNAGL